jgi:fluoride exporter
MRELLFVGAGGFVGANARYLVSAFVAKHVSASLPWGTLLVNVLGSFVLAAFLAWTTERVLADPAYRFLVAIGFCGAFTTFSSYAFETLRLWEQGHTLAAAANLVVNNALALAATLAGLALARWL